MNGTRTRRGEQGQQEARARGTMRIWRWARWAALVLTVSWAVSWISRLVRGEQGWDLWWPLASTVIWTGMTAYGFVTYSRIRTTDSPTVTGRRPV